MRMSSLADQVSSRTSGMAQHWDRYLTILLISVLHQHSLLMSLFDAIEVGEGLLTFTEPTTPAEYRQ